MEILTDSLSGSQIVAISQEQITAAQQMYLDYIDKKPLPDGSAPKVNLELQTKLNDFAELLRTNKEQAHLTISQLVSSANSMTADLTTALTAVPVHPYEKLVYEYLGPNFICPTIQELTIPNNFCSQKCLIEIESIAKGVGALQTSQFARMSAEAMDTAFYGITSENLNNAFAVLSSTPEGERYVIDRAKLADHLRFVETVKSIPTDYVLKNPLEVAKKMLAEFTRIHQPGLNVLTPDKANSLSELPAN